MLPTYLKIWQWECIFGHSVKTISSPGVCDLNLNVFMSSQDALFGPTITKNIPPLRVQYVRKIMYIYQFAFFTQAQTEIIMAATNFEKSAGKLAYAKPLYNNHAYETQ